MCYDIGTDVGVRRYSVLKKILFYDKNQYNETHLIKCCFEKVSTLDGSFLVFTDSTQPS